ncbi:ROK family protein [Streptomyces sp. UNOB3_S3]|uniref:ROK family protein n=1 Tax=Streptomyces sp. UNOB3_S3 TaxID=2871682 RepID=UPI001E3AAE08|nr:ROK family protein [Streptomyces sp. UNOB3_S3]MCC3774248.1 ROK family protein [Streptomyces sp. UNOB3_S3]
MNPSIVAIDVGGTHLRRARWTETGGLTERTVLPSPGKERHPGEPVDRLQARMVDALCDAVPFEAGVVAGISFGAALDHRSGVVYASAPLWGPAGEPFDLLDALRRRRPDVTWHVVNDVTAALVHLAAAPGRARHRRILLATISTGIACRLLDRTTGTIPVDGCGLQGEIGHLPATATLAGRPVELVCDCGTPGHVAAYSSGPGIRRMAEVLRQREPDRWRDSRLGAEHERGTAFEDAFLRALEEGDPLAHDLLTAVTGPVADVLRTALCLSPDIDEVALTGGVAVGLAGHYRRALLGHLERSGLYLTGERAPEWIADRLTVCGPGEADGLVGAGIAALTALRAAAPGSSAEIAEAAGHRIGGEPL